jgi:hypothetical protein
MGAGPQAQSPQLLMIDRHAVADGPRTWTVRQIIDTLKGHSRLRDHGERRPSTPQTPAGEPVIRTASFAPASIAS